MNLKELNLSDHSLIKKGKYKAELISSQKKLSGKNRPMLKFTWKIQEEPYIGRLIDSYITVDNAKNKNVLAILIQHLGFEPSEVEETEELHGAKCNIMIEKVYIDNMSPWNNVTFYLPLSRDDPDRTIN